MTSTDIRRFIDILAEALDNVAEVQWQKTDTVWGGEFKTKKDRWFRISIVQLDRSPLRPTADPGWAFEFSEIPDYVLWITGRAEKPDRAKASHDNPIGNLAPTGRGEQFQVYATVIDAMKEFLVTERPEFVKFKGSTGRQTRFYRSIMRRTRNELRALGYRAKGAALTRID